MKVYSLGSGMDRLQMSAISFNKADNCSNLIYPAFSEIATACLYLSASLHSYFIQFNWNIIYIDSQKSWATDKALLLYIYTYPLPITKFTFCKSVQEKKIFALLPLKFEITSQCARFDWQKVICSCLRRIIYQLKFCLRITGQYINK